MVLITTAYGSTNISSGRSFDISVGGISVVTAATLHEDQSVSLEFQTPQKQLLKVFATVRHHSDNIYGLEFLSATPQQTNEIRRLCDMDS